jgi:AbrB family looped-hinge helix DNA binding protein
MGFHAKSIHLVGTTTVGPKGQVVIPVEARDKMGLMPGDKVIVLYMDDHKTVSFISEPEMQGIINKMGAHLSEVTDSLKQASEGKFED